MEPVTTRAASMQYNFVKQNELCLKCFYTNANSLVNKIEEFKQRVHGYDIIGVISTEKLAAASGRRRWPICWCCLDRGPGSFDVEDATTLSWSSAAVSE